jgi:predicted dienelactone hydrolase
MKPTLKHLFAAAALAACSVVLPACSTQGEAPSYDPLRVTGTSGVHTVGLTVHDAARNRDLPVRVYLPAATNAAPVVLFSHGLGGSCENNPYLGNHWAARGYVAVFVQHPGSDHSVWQGKPLASRQAAMRAAVSYENLTLRVKDIPAVLDQLARWQTQEGHPLAGRLDLARGVGMSGHSFGARTTQAVGGETPPVGPKTTDPRVKAAVMFSPNVPTAGDSVFRNVGIPWLLMTGTKDNSPINNTVYESRLGVFPALPPGDKYELVLEGAEHSAFGDTPLPGDREPRNPNHHRAVLALSTAFWDAYLRNDAAAKAWLTGDGPKSILEAKDRWQKK